MSFRTAASHTLGFKWVHLYTDLLLGSEKMFCSQSHNYFSIEIHPCNAYLVFHVLSGSTCVMVIVCLLYISVSEQKATLKLAIKLKHLPANQ